MNHKVSSENQEDVQNQKDVENDIHTKKITQEIHHNDQHNEILHNGNVDQNETIQKEDHQNSNYLDQNNNIHGDQKHVNNHHQQNSNKDEIKKFKHEDEQNFHDQDLQVDQNHHNGKLKDDQHLNGLKNDENHPNENKHDQDILADKHHENKDDLVQNVINKQSDDSKQCEHKQDNEPHKQNHNDEHNKSQTQDNHNQQIDQTLLIGEVIHNDRQENQVYHANLIEHLQDNESHGLHLHGINVDKQQALKKQNNQEQIDPTKVLNEQIKIDAQFDEPHKQHHNKQHEELNNLGDREQIDHSVLIDEQIKNDKYDHKNQIRQVQDNESHPQLHNEKHHEIQNDGKKQVIGSAPDNQQLYSDQQTDLVDNQNSIEHVSDKEHHKQHQNDQHQEIIDQRINNQELNDHSVLIKQQLHNDRQDDDSNQVKHVQDNQPHKQHDKKQHIEDVIQDNHEQIEPIQHKDHANLNEDKSNLNLLNQHNGILELNELQIDAADLQKQAKQNHIDNHDENKLNNYREEIEPEQNNQLRKFSIDKTISKKELKMIKPKKVIQTVQVEKDSQIIFFPTIQPLGVLQRPKQRQRVMSEYQAAAKESDESSFIETRDLSNQQSKYSVHMTAHQKAQEFIRKMNSQRQEQDSRRLKEQEIVENQYKIRNNQYKIQKDNEESEAKIEKRRRIQEKLDYEKLIKSVHVQINLDGNKLIKQIQSNKQLQDLQSKQKEEEVLNNELERRKLELTRKRELSQPIRLDYLKEHQKKYEEDIKSKQDERNQQKLQASIDHNAKVHKFPKSQTQLRVESEDRLEKDKRIINLEAKKFQKQRQQKYVEVIKDLFPISERKKEDSIKANKKDISKPPTVLTKELIALNLKGYLNGQKKIRQLEKVLHQNGKSQAQLNKQQSVSYSKIILNTEGDISEEISIEKAPQSPMKSQRKSIPMKMLYDPIPQKQPNKDYLKEMRANRRNSMQGEEWEKIMKDETLPLNSRYQNVLTQVYKLEQRAKQKQEIAILNKDSDAEEEVQNLYLNSIKAKLALLQTRNEPSF